MKQSDDLVQALSSAGDAVIGIAVLAGLGAWGGTWLDGKLHTQPLLAISLSLIGMSLGLARMVIKALKTEKEMDKEAKSGKKDQTI